MTDPFRLNRFVEAQAGVFDQALDEIKTGRKRSHWMWFIFPQSAGLGLSPTSQYYAIKGPEEAKAYLEHPILGPRLVQCAQTALSVEGRSALEIFGYPDELKLRSCATLFAGVSPADSVFQRLLKKYFQDQMDENTLRLIGLPDQK